MRVIIWIRADLSGPSADRHYRMIRREIDDGPYELVREYIGAASMWAAPTAQLISACAAADVDGVFTPSSEHLGDGLITASAFASVMAVEPRECWLRGRRVDRP